ncbi:LysR family transcriptional regulator [Aneurinibacillus sp. Ricciae_BoGa-3]|uniref:LysR family transcriptional regulator n=1 Tax=Aneurinibacillus sp. Ricciae_BoGa-3 TaxID=3022697 RepID=UPI00233FE9D4|nr:LysR family transcriptional regulator [Aneurinibacillus sp. Ricciae_BoGa-3]WCK52737.1 LysR family transcriptional regulator [Aneurinibacillus sp. Ricciae_BoGa-3]
MELRQLLYAVTITEEKSFSKAAEKLHLAQPSLSQQIAKLEKEIGVVLFERSSSPIRLTYAGERFFEKAVRILDQMDHLKKEMEDVADLTRGDLTIGCLPITGAHILPLVLPVYKEKYPGIQIKLVEEKTAELEQMTARGAAELSLLWLPVQDPNLEWIEMVREEICLAVPPGHPLSGAGEVEVGALKEEPFIMLKQGQGFRHLALNWCMEAGFAPRIVFESSNIETVQALVAAGMGVAFIPKMITRPAAQEFIPNYLSLVSPRPFRTLVLAYKRGRYLSRAAHAFQQTVKEVLLTGEKVSGWI